MNAERSCKNIMILCGQSDILFLSTPPYIQCILQVHENVQGIDRQGTHDF